MCEWFFCLLFPVAVQPQCSTGPETSKKGWSGCKCLGWNSTSGVSFDAQECVDKSCFLAFMWVWVVGWKVLGTTRLLSWRPEATSDLWPRDSWSVTGRGFWRTRLWVRADASEGACHNGQTIDVRGGVGDGVPLIKSCVSEGFSEVKTWGDKVPVWWMSANRFFSDSAWQRAKIFRQFGQHQWSGSMTAPDRWCSGYTSLLLLLVCMFCLLLQTF